MGWFDEQIRQRTAADEAGFSQAFAEMSGVIMGQAAAAQAMTPEKKARNAIDEILKYYHVSGHDVPASVTDLNGQLEHLLRPAGIMRRSVRLEGPWYNDAFGAMLCQTLEGEPVALIPSGINGYSFFDWQAGRRVKLNKTSAARLAPDAICFYKPLPARKLTKADLFTYIRGVVAPSDLCMALLAALAAAAVGLIAPYANRQIFLSVIPSGQTSLLWPVFCLLLGVTVSTTLIGAIKGLCAERIKTKLSISVQAATMMRVLSLPAAFFKRFSAGELASRVFSVNSLCDMLVGVVLSAGLTSVFSLVYIGQIGLYAPTLTLPALATVLATTLFSIAVAVAQTRVNSHRMKADAEASGLVYQLFSGVSKIKLAGAERRGFAKWAKQYSEVAKWAYNPPLLTKLGGIVPVATSLLGTLLIYHTAAVSGVSPANYMAFSAAYGLVTGAFAELSGMATTFALIQPTLEMLSPILSETPEVSSEKSVVNRLSGQIEVSNVTFRYKPDAPVVLENLSLKIKPGQYVAIVGPTGCGKSTLFRLLLGFEQPQKGAIFYDGKDMSRMDLKSLRQNIGVVLQNGKLFQGDIFSNIAICAPALTLQGAWEAAELAGVAQDIRAMPMGMNTLISEGAGGISGGQRQRLLIARAIASRPKILMFDEATSALDNITQKKVAESLNALKCTRLVIAHRLSTIRQCDRIIVLENGRIAEDGDYEALIAKDGLFAELVRRQRLDDGSRYVDTSPLF